jgi:hypothetical protein
MGMLSSRTMHIGKAISGQGEPPAYWLTIAGQWQGMPPHVEYKRKLLAAKF